MPRRPRLLRERVAHQGGERSHFDTQAASLVGVVVGLAASLALIVVVFGPLLWAPTIAGLEVWRRLDPGGWDVLAGIVAGGCVFTAQIWLLMRLGDSLRTLALAALALGWCLLVQQMATTPGYDFSTLPPAHAAGHVGWAMILIATAIYTAIGVLMWRGLSHARHGVRHWRQWLPGARRDPLSLD